MPWISDAELQSLRNAAGQGGTRPPAPGSVTITNGVTGGPTNTDQAALMARARAEAEQRSLAPTPGMVNNVAKADAPQRWRPGMPERMSTDWGGWKPSGPGWFFSAKENTWRNDLPVSPLDQKQFSSDWYHFHNYRGRLGEKPPEGATWNGREWDPPPAAAAPPAQRPPVPPPVAPPVPPPVAPPVTSVPPPATAPTAKTPPRDQGAGPNPSAFPTVAPDPVPQPGLGAPPRPPLRAEGGGGLPTFDLGMGGYGFGGAPTRAPNPVAPVASEPDAPPPPVAPPVDAPGPGGGGADPTPTSMASDEHLRRPPRMGGYDWSV